MRDARDPRAIPKHDGQPLGDTFRDVGNMAGPAGFNPHRRALRRLASTVGLACREPTYTARVVVRVRRRGAANTLYACQPSKVPFPRFRLAQTRTSTTDCVGECCGRCLRDSTSWARAQRMGPHAI
jgi:hypothetical protein